MQTPPIIFHVLREWRVILDHAFLFVPEQVFGETHFGPVRRPVTVSRNGNLLPPALSSIVRDELQFAAARALHQEAAVMTRVRTEIIDHAGKLQLLG